MCGSQSFGGRSFLAYINADGHQNIPTQRRAALKERRGVGPSTQILNPVAL
jgi:hypothetical protein